MVTGKVLPNKNKKEVSGYWKELYQIGQQSAQWIENKKQRSEELMF